MSHESSSSLPPTPQTDPAHFTARRVGTALALAGAIAATAGLSPASAESAPNQPKVQQLCTPDADGSLGLVLTNGEGTNSYQVDMAPANGNGKSLLYSNTLAPGASERVTSRNVPTTGINARYVGSKLYVDWFDASDNIVATSEEVFCDPNTVPTTTPIPATTPKPSTPTPVQTTPKPVETQPTPTPPNTVIIPSPNVIAPAPAAPEVPAKPNTYKVPTVKPGMSQADADRALKTVPGANFKLGKDYLETGKKDKFGNSLFRKINAAKFKPAKKSQKLVLKSFAQKGTGKHGKKTEIPFTANADVAPGTEIDQIFKLGKAKGKKLSATQTGVTVNYAASNIVNAAALSWSKDNCTSLNDLFSPYSNANGYLSQHPELVQDQTNPETIALQKLDCTPTFAWAYKRIRDKTDGYDLEAGLRSQLSDAARQGKRAEFVLYEIPNRDLGGASAGGAKTDTEYRDDVDLFDSIVAGKSVDVIVEPDALADVARLHDQPAQQAARIDNLSYAVSKLASDANNDTYLDAGNETYNKPSMIAGWAYAAGVCKNIVGLSFNVSNYYSEQSEYNYAQKVQTMIARIAVRHGLQNCAPKVLIDTSRNGAGSVGIAQDPPIDKVAAGNYPGTVMSGNGPLYKRAWVNYPGGVDRQVVDSQGKTRYAGEWVKENAIRIMNHPQSGVLNLTNFTAPAS